MTEPYTMGNTVLHHKIKCKYSGLTIGTLDVITTAGAIPYVSYWDKCIAYHPVFSLEPLRLFKFVKGEWDRMAQRAVDSEVSQAESDILCVGYLAVLHTLDCIRQDQPSLPPLAIVHTTIGKLFNLAYWKWKLESERFTFPTLHLSKHNKNLDFSNLDDYLELCFDVRKDYEKRVRTADEKAQLDAATAAIKALSSEWVTPTSKRLIWTWVKAHLPEKYSADAQGWLSTLFLGGSNAIVDFDKEDIELAEEIVSSSCPNGTGVMFAVRQRLQAIRTTWEQYHEAYTIDLADYADEANTYVNGEKLAAPHPGPRPELKDYQFNKARFYVAEAKWEIAAAAYLKSGGIL
jgi:hypothetical protein